VRTHSLFALLLLLLLLDVATAANPRNSPENLPHPPYPVFALLNSDQGKIMVKVTFARNGRVAECQIRSSSVSEKLAKATTDFIAANWRSKARAGTTLLVPIIYNLPKLPFPYPYYPAAAVQDRQAGVVVVSVTFDPDGRATKCKVLSSTASPLLEASTCAFIQEHWADKNHHGQTAIVPIIYALGR
jgi:TonB family protein